MCICFCSKIFIQPKILFNSLEANKTNMSDFDTTENVYRFYMDCGRSGSIEAMFVAQRGEVQLAIDQGLHFHEVLGKHSEIVCESGEDYFGAFTDVDPKTLEFIKDHPCGCVRNELDEMKERILDNPDFDSEIVRVFLLHENYDVEDYELFWNRFKQEHKDEMDMEELEELVQEDIAILRARQTKKTETTNEQDEYEAKVKKVKISA